MEKFICTKNKSLYAKANGQVDLVICLFSSFTKVITQVDFVSTLFSFFFFSFWKLPLHL